MAENHNYLVETVNTLLRQGNYEELDILTLEPGENVRHPQSLALPTMIQSIKTRGWLADSTIFVSRRKDGVLRVLRGNRRTQAAQELRRLDADAFARAFQVGSHVHCLVFDGLTPEQEILIRNDHSNDLDSKKLNDWEIFLAVKQYVKVGGHTEAGIAIAMGQYTEDKDQNKVPNRSYIQKRVQLATLPAFVQAEFCKLWMDNKSATLARVGMIPQFAAAIASDVKDDPTGMGVSPIDGTPLEFSAGGGPEFLKLWNSNMVPDSTEAKEAEAEADAGKAKAVISHKDLSARVNSYDGRLLKDIVRCITGEQSHTSMVELDARCVTLESIERDYIIVGKFLGSDGLQSLLAQARTAYPAPAEAKANVTVGESIAANLADSTDTAPEVATIGNAIDATVSANMGESAGTMANAIANTVGDNSGLEPVPAMIGSGAEPETAVQPEPAPVKGRKHHKQ